MKRLHLLYFIASLALCLTANAQVKVSVEAPRQVIAGDQFRVSYSVNTADVSSYKVGDFTGAEILYGPSRSQSSSVSIINGKTTQSSSITYTYTLLAQTKGTYRLPQFSVVVNGSTYTSVTPQFEVLPGGSSTQQQGGGQGSSGYNQQHVRPRMQSSGEVITGRDLFVEVIPSKRKVFEQEAILLTYKVYWLVSLSNLSSDDPKFEGFHVQEINPRGQRYQELEYKDGRNYNTVVWHQYLLFPQQSGKLTIPAVKYDVTVVQQDPNVDPFDAFFYGGSMMQEVSKTIMAPAVTIDVDPLPTPKPSSFTGAVGQFKMTSSLDPISLKANDATTMRLQISGTGNMKLMRAPEVAWPKDFESYPPKTEEKTELRTSGVSGTMSYEYLAVPRHQGSFDVPAVEFTYFDPAAKSYKTLTSEAYKMEVLKGDGAVATHAVAQEDIEMLGLDIRYIKTGDSHVISADKMFFGSRNYALAYAVPLVLFILAFIVFRRRAAANADIARQRTRKASKAASRRLKQARKMMKAKNDNAFYEETMKALWGYMADKLSLPVSELNKENVRARLEQRGAAPELTEAFLHAIDECEFARFAPGDAADTMGRLYKEAEAVIDKMESQLRK